MPIDFTDGREDIAGEDHAGWQQPNTSSREYRTTSATTIASKIDETLDRTERVLLERQSERLMIAFEHIREGLGIYDGNERLVMMNPRYAEMYQVPAYLQVPGTTFSKLLAYWSKIGLLASRESRDIRTKTESTKAGGRFHLHLLDGRTYEMNEQALPGGGWVSTHEDITEQVAAEKRISFLAHHDALTGLSNRGAFHERLNLLIAEAGSEGPARFSLIMFDLDRFKPVNDLYGHSAGDQVLVEVGTRARLVFGPDAMVARLGGDEFAVLVEINDQTVVAGLAAELADTLRQPIACGRQRIELGASIGLAFYPDQALSAGELVKCADRALYAAKSQSLGSIVTYYAELDAMELARVELIRRLPEAMCDGEIELYFQPIISAVTGICQTAEALLRWTHPKRGRIPPEHIIAIAEESRQIHQLGDWILRHALHAAQDWPPSISVAVNLSASQFKAPGFSDSVISAIEAAEISPARLELELTETVLCTDDAAETIAALREAGVRFSLDDFGTGYASMSYLLRFPFDHVKIDRSFVTDIDSRPDRRIIVEAITGLAQKLGLGVVAEGVESDAEQRILNDLGCDFMQGYLHGRPMPASEFKDYVQAQLQTRS